MLKKVYSIIFINHKLITYYTNKLNTQYSTWVSTVQMTCHVVFNCWLLFCFFFALYVVTVYGWNKAKQIYANMTWKLNKYNFTPKNNSFPLHSSIYMYILQSIGSIGYPLWLLEFFSTPLCYVVCICICISSFLLNRISTFIPSTI